MIKIKRLPGDFYLPLHQWQEMSVAATKKLITEQVRGGAIEFNDRIWRQPKLALISLFNEKCPACESAFNVDTFPDVSHFRPKGRVVEDKSFPGYWWLAYDWDNLFVFCTRCHQMKGGRFPIAGTRARTPSDHLSKEQPFLLDPCIDDPSVHLAFDDDGRIVGRTERGRITIEVFGLNREALVEARYKSIVFLLSQARAAISLASRSRDSRTLESLFISDEVPFAAARRAALHRFVLGKQRELEPSPVGRKLIRQARKAHPIDHKEIERLASEAVQKEVEYSVESVEEAHSAAFLAAQRRIERIEIRDFKSIETLSIKFPTPQSDDQAWLMLLGENATGKSSILQAIALALMGQSHANSLGLDAKAFLRHNAKRSQGLVEIHLTNLSSPVRMKFGKSIKGFRITPSEPKVLLLGYGATRLLPRPGLGKSDQNKYIRIKNLFDPTAPLNDADRWLSDKTQVPQQKFEEVADGLREALLLPPHVKANRERGFVEFVYPNDRIRLSELSDGYQSVIAMIADIAFCIFEKWSSLKDAEAIVLLDEIEVHLHPSWKMTIVERLRRCFPRLSFIVTTHDPLCLRGLRNNEVIVLRRDEAGAISPLTDIPDLDGFRADQLLTSPLFGLETTRGPQTETDRTRYAVLLEKKKRSSSEEVEYRALETKLGALSIDERVKSSQSAGSVENDTLDVLVERAMQQITTGISSELRKRIAQAIAPAGDSK